MFEIYRRETAAPELDLLPPTPPVTFKRSELDAEGLSMHYNELFRATHNTVTVLDASIHWASLPRMKARAEPSW
jgi:hypothetical protein